MAESVISLQGLELAFGEKKVLQGVDLEVKKGETMAVIGPSGTGKSTILKVLIGLLAPTGGKVLIEGQDVSGLTEEEWNEIRKHIGMVFQYSALFDFLDVGENVAFGLRQHFRLPEEEVRQKVDGLLQDVGMEDAKHLYPVELSGGMKKRVSLARALAIEPRIVLYDEPTAQRPATKAEIINYLNYNSNFYDIGSYKTIKVDDMELLLEVNLGKDSTYYVNPYVFYGGNNLGSCDCRHMIDVFGETRRKQNTKAIIV